MSQTEFIKFNVPLDYIEKGTNKAGIKVMKVGGCASTEAVDFDEESLDPNGFETSYFLTHGFINYNHQGKVNPEANIGEPVTAEVRDNQFHITGELYSDNAIAKSTYRTMQSLKLNKSKRRMCWSVEGKVLERDAKNPKRITRLLVTGVALTLNPKNPDTYADILKGHVDSTMHDGDVLSQVEVYAQIFDAFPALEKGMADQIMELIEFIAAPDATTPMAEKTAKNTIIRPDHVEKAFATLRSTASVEAGAVAAEPDDIEDNPDELIQKGIDSSVEMLRQGLGRATIMKSLLNEGLDAPTAATTFSTAAAQFADEEGQEEEEEEEPEATNPEPEYIEDDEPEEDEPAQPAPGKKSGTPNAQTTRKPAEPSRNNAGVTAAVREQLDEVIKGLGSAIDSRFASVGVLFENVLDKVDQMQAAIEQRLDAIDDAPNPRKSQNVVKSFQERPFVQQSGQTVEKSLDGEPGAAGGRRVLSLKANRDEVLNLLDARINYDDPKNTVSKGMLDDMMHFEQIGTISKSVAAELQQKHQVVLID